MGRWIDASKKLPRKSGHVLIYDRGIQMVTHYSAVHKAFNAYDEHEPEYAMYPTHWQSLPREPEVTVHAGAKKV